MSRRQMANELGKCYEQLMARKFNLDEQIDDEDEFVSGDHQNLELLMALRRSQKRPDPLTIRIGVEEGKVIKCDPLTLPTIKCTLENVDSEKQSISFQFGGNYRSGRQTRFRVELRNTAGELLPRKLQYGIINGGGISRSGELEFGRKWETKINLQAFVDFPKPGKYDAEIMYHDQNTIAFADDVNGLIVAKSRKFEIEILTVEITVTKAQQSKVLLWISEIDGRSKQKIIAGSYGEWAHEFVPPDSPSGKILTMGLAAVPVLIDQLEREESTQMRAIILGFLFSSTGQFDPRGCKLTRFGSPIGDYQCQEGSWAVFGG